MNHTGCPGGAPHRPPPWGRAQIGRASAVKSFKVSATGVSAAMHDAVQACREVLELLGAVRGTGTGLSELAAALREDLAPHDTQPHLGIPTSG